MKTANGINIAEKTKTPMRQAVEYFENIVNAIEIQLDRGQTRYTETDLETAKLDLHLVKRLLHEEKEIINEAYEDGNCDGQSGEYNSGYFELNFES